MTEHEQRYHLSVSGLPDMKLINPQGDFSVPGGEVTSIGVQVQIDPVHLKRPVNEIYFSIQSLSNEKLHLKQKARFLGPVMR